MSADEAWAMIESAHTGVFTTLSRDGWPVSLPVWFAVLDRAVFVRTPAGAKKLDRIRRDDRGCFLVERGERWAELAAVEMRVRASIVADPAVEHEVGERLDAKYAGFRTTGARMPAATKKHYAAAILLRLHPAGPLVTWDNARLRLRS